MHSRTRRSCLGLEPCGDHRVSRLPHRDDGLGGLRVSRDLELAGCSELPEQALEEVVAGEAPRQPLDASCRHELLDAQVYGRGCMP